MIMASTGSRAPDGVAGWPATTTGVARATRVTASLNTCISAPLWRMAAGESSRTSRRAPARRRARAAQRAGQSRSASRLIDAPHVHVLVLEDEGLEGGAEIG